MTTEDFLTELMIYFRTELEKDQLKIYKRHLNTFQDYQLDDLFEEALKHCKQFPKIAHLVSIADDQLGILSAYKKEKKRKPKWSDWEPTSCRLCHGEGRLMVWFEMFTQRDEEGGLRTLRKLVQIDQLSDPDLSPERPKGCVKYVFRCSCSAGIRPGLPGAWPRWKEFEDVVEYKKQQAGDLDPDPFMMNQVKDIVQAAGPEEVTREPKQEGLYGDGF